jgi:competence protein ComEC
MTDKILLLALALTAGSALARAPIPAAMAAMLALFLLRSRLAPWMLVVLATALGIGAWRSRLAIDSATALHARVVETLGAPGRCEGDAYVIRSPVVQHGEDKPDGSAAGDARIEIEMIRGSCERGPLVEPLRARLHGAPEDLARGDLVHVIIDVAPVHLFLNEALPDPRPFIARSRVAASGAVVDLVRLERGTGITAWIDRARVHVRRRIEATFHPEANPLARALVLGETDLRLADDEAFRRSGLSHLLAVSGTHLVLAVAGIAAALRALLVRFEVLAARYDVGRFAAVFAIPTSWMRRCSFVRWLYGPTACARLECRCSLPCFSIRSSAVIPRLSCPQQRLPVSWVSIVPSRVFSSEVPRLCSSSCGPSRRRWRR